MRSIWAQGMVLLLIVSFLAGCAGRTAQPVAEYQYGDEKKECAVLKHEASECQNKVTMLTKKSDNTQGANAALAVTGMLLFWPALFFMDLSDSDRIELEALRKRHNALVKLCVDKNCGYDLKEMPPFPTQAPAQDDMAQDGGQLQTTPAVATAPVPAAPADISH